MPDDVYIARREPPSRVDRATARPFEHVWAGFSVFVGIALLVNAGMDGVLLGVQRLPTLVYVLLGVPILAGAVSALVGLQWPRATRSRGWDVERGGWWVLIGAWFLVIIVLLFLTPKLWFGIMFAAFTIVAALLRIRLLRIIESQAREYQARTGGDT